MLIVFGAVAIAVRLTSFAQQPSRMRRIGVLQQYGANDPEGQRRVAAFLHGLQEAGWVESQNFTLEIRYVNGMFDRQPALLAELLQANVDVIITAGTESIQAAKRATSTVPIVMATIGDPVATGIVASLARPGGNITGLSNFATELTAKRLELIASVVPSGARVAILWNPNNASVVQKFKESEAAAMAKGVRLESFPVRVPADVDHAFRRAQRAGAKAVMLADDILLIGERARIVELAVRYRFPLISEFSLFADAGALLSYGPDQFDMWRRAATYADKILKGARPGDLPIEQPIKFELVINMKTAKALGIKIPQSILLRADKVIE